MEQDSNELSRQRIVELADSPIYRPFIVGYLVQALDERYWPKLVQVALEHVERIEELQAADETRVEALVRERFE